MEDYPHTCLRVKLAKKGLSQIFISELFADYTLEELQSSLPFAKALVEELVKAFEGDATVLAPIEDIVKVMMEPSNTTIKIDMKRKANGFWSLKMLIG